MITVGRRYHRSVSLTLDWGRPAALRGYLVSPLVKASGERIMGELIEDGGNRAWSLIGPYGTGKSAFTLFLSTLLTEEGPAQETLLDRLQLPDDLREAFGQKYPKPWMPVLVVGERTPILQAVLKALYKTVVDARPSKRGKPPRIQRDLKRLLDQIEAGRAAVGSEILDLVDEVIAYFSSRFSGVLFVFDELGKFLEHAASSLTRTDIHFLQQLSERCSRSSEFPIAVLTVLHQSFSMYSEGLPDRERQEWEKVQGRFDEIPFIEPVDHLVSLAGSAIERDGSQSKLDGLHSKSLKKLAVQFPEARLDFLKALQLTSPLHPVVAALLGPVFRGALAQNERSLFAFLVSAEPGGFDAYLRDSEGTPTKLYSVSKFYEYISCVLAAGLGRRRHDRVLGMSERALAKLAHSESDQVSDVVKAIALLERFGEAAGLTANLSTISMCVGLTEPKTARHIRGLDRYIVHRQFSDTYHLWDGSDVDLEQELRAARQIVEKSGNIAAVLEKHVALRPVVAGRHFHHSGTMRCLEPRLVEETAFNGELHPQDSSNGLMVYVLPKSAKGAQELIERLEDATFRNETLPHPATVVAVTEDASRIREQALALLALDHALSTSKALKLDPVARRELELQLSEASNRLFSSLGTAFGWGSTRSNLHSAWFTRAEGRCSAPRRISQLASDVMDLVYRDAPKIRNELLNRSKLSSQAAKARRELVQAMIGSGTQEELGFQGNPPELSMYRSVLVKSGMHTPGKDVVWNRPSAEYGEVWDALLELLEERDEPMALNELYAHFSTPPYGIREGALPVLLVGQLLAQPERLTLFEDGSLVPMLELEVAERLLRRPKTFAIRAFAVTDGRERVLKAIMAKIPSKKSPEPTVLNATKSLLKLIRHVPEYSRVTNEISREAKGVRTAILTARDPHQLLFERLPGELKLKGSVEEDPDRYVSALVFALQEVLNAEEALLSRLHGKILGAFDAADQEEMVARCKGLPDAGLASLVAGFRLRAQEEMERDEWVYAIATFLVHRPPDKWRDSDESVFELKLKEVAALVRRYERIVGLGDGVPKLYLSIMATDGSERSDFALLRDSDEGKTHELATAFSNIVAEGGFSRDQVLRAVATMVSDSEGESQNA